MAGSNVELGVVMKRLRVKLLQFLLVFEVQVEAIAEPCCNRSIQLVGQPKYIDRGVQLPFLFFELDGC